MSFPQAPLTKLPRLAQWGLLFVASIVIGAVLEAAGLPAAVLLGPMIAGILVRTNGGGLRVPRPLHYAAQAVIGCLVASAITPAIIVTFSTQWPLFLAAVLSVILAGALLGLLMSRMGVLPTTTAIWGLSPGGASAMMLMADAFGADARLVAFMQYTRVVFVTFAASLIVRVWHDASGASMPHVIWFAPINWPAFGETLALIIIGGGLGYVSRVPVGSMLVPLFVGAMLHATRLIAIDLPYWLLAICYTALGWSIGLGFTREILLHAARAVPQTVVSILVLMIFCGGIAVVLVKTLSIDPLTAYLATSPGGMDSVAIIAASSKVDVAFVMALQTVRFAIVLMAGPTISRLVAREISRVPVAEKSEASQDIAETLERIREDEGDLD